jgi:hypothetical protein
MLTCLPKSICSWDFRVLGASVQPAAVDFDLWSEQGAIHLGSTTFVVRKHGPLSGRWTLELDGDVHCEAQKSLLRVFHVRHRDLEIDLRARPFSRTFDLAVAGRAMGSIVPVHPMTRRTVIEHDPAVPEPLVLFCFWLAALTWRRSRRD